MSTSTQNVTHLTAYREWAARPADERFQSVDTLYASALAQTTHTRESLVSVPSLQVEPLEHACGLALGVPGSGRYAFTHWSFGQLAALVGAGNTSILRKIRAEIAAAAMNDLLGKIGRQPTAKLYVDESARVVRALTAEGYGRVSNTDVTLEVLRLMFERPALHLPLSDADSGSATKHVPSGAYLGDRDMFVFLVDSDRYLDDPTDRSRQGMLRGIMVRNSDVGAASLEWDVFYHRGVCSNRIIFGFRHLEGRRRRHVRSLIRDWRQEFVAIRAALDRDTTRDRELVRRAQQVRVVTGAGPRSRQALRAEVVETIGVWSRRTVPAAIIGSAFDYAEQHEPDATTVWGMVQGLTALSQRTPYQDARFALDRVATSLLRRVPHD